MPPSRRWKPSSRRRTSGTRPISPACAAPGSSPRRKPRKAGAGPRARSRALTGGDPITARFMRQDFFTYLPAFKLVIAGNHKPGAARRRRGDPAPVSPDAVHRDDRRPDSATICPRSCKAEWPGILQWMIEGCLAWQRDGLSPPAIVRDATDSLPRRGGCHRPVDRGVLRHRQAALVRQRRAVAVLAALGDRRERDRRITQALRHEPRKPRLPARAHDGHARLSRPRPDREREAETLFGGTKLCRPAWLNAVENPAFSPFMTHLTHFAL